MMRLGMAKKPRCGRWNAAGRTLMQPLSPAVDLSTMPHRTTRVWRPSELLESGAAIIIAKEWYKQDLRETLLMAGAEVV